MLGSDTISTTKISSTMQLHTSTLNSVCREAQAAASSAPHGPAAEPAAISAAAPLDACAVLIAALAV